MPQSSQNDEVFEQGEQHLLALIKEMAKIKGISQEQIAIATGWRQSNVNKLLNGAYSPTLKMFLKLASSVGVNFFVEDKASESQLNQAHEKAMESMGRRKPKNLN